MREWFFFVLIASVPTAILIWLLYSFAKYLYTVYEEWRELKVLDAIQSESVVRREGDRLEDVQRLDNGCQHAFDTGSGFPPGVCPKCGLEAKRPAGACDHVWRRVDGPSPASACAKCGKTYRAEL
jgi:hypothetical protein